LAAGLRLREAVKARYKAKIIYCKSAQIRAIRGDSPAKITIYRDSHLAENVHFCGVKD